MESAVEARDFTNQEINQAVVAAIKSAIDCSCSDGLSCLDGLCT
jgi:hypothetical protein